MNTGSQVLMIMSKKHSMPINNLKKAIKTNPDLKKEYNKLLGIIKNNKRKIAYKGIKK